MFFCSNHLCNVKLRCMYNIKNIYTWQCRCNGPTAMVGDAVMTCMQAEKAHLSSLHNKEERTTQWNDRELQYVLHYFTSDRSDSSKGRFKKNAADITRFKMLLYRLSAPRRATSDKNGDDVLSRSCGLTAAELSELQSLSKKVYLYIPTRLQ